MDKIKWRGKFNKVHIGEVGSSPTSIYGNTKWDDRQLRVHTELPDGIKFMTS
jgi:hypothetical protein